MTVKIVEGMNGPMMRPQDAPDTWVMNVQGEGGHDKKNYCYDLNGAIKAEDCPCMCVVCVRERVPGLRVGDPVQVHPAEEWTVELLKAKGLVGLYRTNGGQG